MLIYFLKNVIYCLFIHLQLSIQSLKCNGQKARECHWKDVDVDSRTPSVADPWEPAGEWARSR